MSKDKKRLRAILYLVIASVLWSTGGVLIKLTDMHPAAIAGSRSFIASIVILIYLRKFSFKQSKTMYLGALAYASTVILFVIANKMTTAANTILLQYTAPIWVALLGGYILKEKISKIDWISIGVVTAGMVLFFIGKLDSGQMAGNFVAVISGLTLSLVVIFLRLLKSESTVTMPLLGNIVTFVVTLPFILKTDFTSSNMLGVFLLGTFQLGFSYIFFATALKEVSAIEGILIPVIEPLLNPVWVLIFTGETPTVFAIIGGIVVIVAVTVRSIISARNERRLAREKNAV